MSDGRQAAAIALLGNYMAGIVTTADCHGGTLLKLRRQDPITDPITLEAESVGLPPFRQGIEFPNPDFAALARACGGHGFRVTKPGELHAEINEAFNVDGPAIVNCVVAADEMPNFPHLELDKLRNYAVAKIKEAILAVTGS